jgi:glycosyltransferase involved in cell wall biosynthesis
MIRESSFKGPKRILIIADPRSPLSMERGLVGLKGGYQVYRYSFPKSSLQSLTGTASPSASRLQWLSFFFSPFFLKQEIGRIRPDLIHVFYGYQQLNNLVLSQFRPLIVTIMGGDVLPDQSFCGRKKWLIKKMLDGSDIITSKSDFLDEVLHGIGGYGYKIRRVTWGVDTEQFSPGKDVGLLRERLNIGADMLIFFSPRICKPFYNQHQIMEAFAIYRSSSGAKKKSKLLIAQFLQDEKYIKRLKEQATELGLQEHVRFVGPIPHQEMPLYFNLADIMVSTPPSDGMPQSLYEAMACGTYPILGNLPHYQEMVEDGVNGRLVKIGDVGSLSEAMAWAADHPGHRKAIAAYNRKRILEVADKEVQEKKVNSIYDELLRR